MVIVTWMDRWDEMKSDKWSVSTQQSDLLWISHKNESVQGISNRANVNNQQGQKLILAWRKNKKGN